jgi:hypothetical protein
MGRHHRHLAWAVEVRAVEVVARAVEVMAVAVQAAMEGMPAAEVGAMVADASAEANLDSTQPRAQQRVPAELQERAYP